MACLLRNRKRENDDGGMEQMASATHPNVYLEAVEETQNQDEKPDEIRCARLEGLCGCIFPKSLLEMCQTRLRK